MRVHLGDACEQLIGQQSDVRPHARELGRECEAIERPVWVIGHDNQRAARRHAVEFGVGDLDLNRQRVERTRGERRRVERRAGFVEIAERAEARQPVEGPPDEARKRIGEPVEAGKR